MAAMSDWLERILSSHIFGSGTFSKPGTIAVALCSGDPTDAMSGNNIPELPNVGAYARQVLAPSATNWLDPVAADGRTSNNIQITFPNAQSNWGWVSGVAIIDSGVYGAGNVLLHGALTTPKLVGSGDQFRFSVNELGITFA